MKNFLLIIGTRPEAIKLIPVYKALKEKNGKVKIVSTGQHKELIEPIWNLFEVEPDIQLNVAKPNQNLSLLTATLTIELNELIEKEKFEYIIVQGDTTSCMVGSLIGFYNKIKVVHIEAGLRTYNMNSPFPEELNRRITSLVATLNFTPTAQSKQNLEKENVIGKIIETGNTGIDSLILILKKVRDKEGFYVKSFGRYLTNCNILITGHRRENQGERFVNIFTAIKELAIENPTLSFIYPVHFNPNVRGQVNQILKGISNIHLIEPVNYDEMIFLMDKSFIIMTDSGGIQEEAPSLNKPVIILRDTTERPEGVEAGCSIMAGIDKDKIKETFYGIFSNETVYNNMTIVPNPYGDGKASKRIAEYLMSDNV